MTNIRPHVRLYTRRRCHLCDEAKRQILAAGLRDRYTLEEIDIDSDPALVARYGTEIPVVTIDGAHVFKYHLTAQDFRREIEAAEEKRKG